MISCARSQFSERRRCFFCVRLQFIDSGSGWGSRLRACRDVGWNLFALMCLLSSIITPILNDKLDAGETEKIRKLTRGQESIFVPCSSPHHVIAEHDLTFVSGSVIFRCSFFRELRCVIPQISIVPSNNLEVKIKIY